MNKTWTELESSDAIRERLDLLESSEAMDDPYGEADIVMLGDDSPRDGIIKEVRIERLGLHYVNDSWRDEAKDFIREFKLVA